MQEVSGVACNCRCSAPALLGLNYSVCMSNKSEVFYKRLDKQKQNNIHKLEITTSV